MQGGGGNFGQQRQMGRPNQGQFGQFGLNGPGNQPSKKLLGQTGYGPGQGAIPQINNNQRLGTSAPGKPAYPNTMLNPNSVAAKANPNKNKQGWGQKYTSPAAYLGYAAGTTFVFGGNTYVSGGDGTMTSYYDSGYQGVSQPAGVQSYQVPSGYEGSSAGSVINYGGVTYTVAVDGTMSPTVGDYGSSAPTQTVAAQRYQIPTGYENSAVGSVISYGGACYVIGGDGTMSPASADDGASVLTQPTQPAAQRYQIPAGYENSAVGSLISYGGASYIIGSDGTMSPSGDAALTPSQPVASTPSQPVAAKRYQIPAQFAGSAAGLVITYGGATYLTAADGTMTVYSGPVGP